MSNVGTVDRLVRVVVGAGLLSLFFVLENRARYYGLIGLVPLATAAIGYCPAYSLLGIRTKKV